MQKCVPGIPHSHLQPCSIGFLFHFQSQSKISIARKTLGRVWPQTLRLLSPDAGWHQPLCPCPSDSADDSQEVSILSRRRASPAEVRGPCKAVCISSFLSFNWWLTCRWALSVSDGSPLRAPGSIRTGYSLWRAARDAVALVIQSALFAWKMSP